MYFKRNLSWNVLIKWFNLFIFSAKAVYFHATDVSINPVTSISPKVFSVVKSSGVTIYSFINQLEVFLNLFKYLKQTDLNHDMGLWARAMDQLIYPACSQ